MRTKATGRVLRLAAGPWAERKKKMYQDWGRREYSCLSQISFSKTFRFLKKISKEERRIGGWKDF
jgi:hypothetical protein